MQEDFAYEKNLQYAKTHGLNYVATNDVHYTKKEQWKSHDVLICMQGGKSIHDTQRKRYAPEEFYMRSPEEMRELFADAPECCDATVSIAERCDLKLDLKTYHLPTFPIPETEPTQDPDEFLRLKTERGLVKRYGEITPDLEKRMIYELEVIKKMGFASYFLITLDFIEYARAKDIPVGLGRGSAAGSIVAYATGITNSGPFAGFVAST